jgi:hypothetical protein
LANLASRQHGIVTSRQLRALGITERAIEYRLRVGRLHRIHRGVYGVGHRNPSELTLFIAAVAAIGPHAVLSHRAAGALWGLTRRGPAIDVATQRSVKRRNGIRLHVPRELPPEDVTRHHGIPVTTPARTLADLARVLPTRQLERAIHEAEVQRLVTHDELKARAALYPLVADGPAPTRSDLEDATLALLRRHDFPRPTTNTTLPDLPRWLEVDFHFPNTRLVIEADGGRFHHTRWRQQQDARKQALLEAAGYRVIRVTWEQVTDDEARTVHRLRHALDLEASAHG